ncbi:MAG: SlyX family protein [Acidimicrobiales bacterium]|nr:SlyX family protein [Acidimicrobiales bacterium]MXX43164.1 SlyX family protein [Acidimicrobiales bacterium]MXY02779.1 SlyX family protein [Acidimicrobiales bacterium]MXZ14946.1 SlyX family protein [Acidimicrobiales bacterium]MYB82073.1 SlyX family protein [Acidimicrobiales bacterium]
MAAGVIAATQLVVEAWAVLVVGGAMVVGMLGTGLGIVFHLGGRIDGQSDRIDRLTEEVALVRERVARLEGSTGTPDPSSLQPA